MLMYVRMHWQVLAMKSSVAHVNVWLWAYCRYKIRSHGTLVILYTCADDHPMLIAVQSEIDMLVYART